jgi:hypothetical protein
MAETVQPAGGRIDVENVPFEIFDEDGIGRVLKYRVEQPLPFFEFVSAGSGIHRELG